MTDLSEMGYTAQLIARLLEVAGPLTLDQIKRWVAEDKTVDVTIEDILTQMVRNGLVDIDQHGLYRGIGESTCLCGGSRWDHRRLTEATRDAAHWKAQAANLSDIVEAQYDENQIPLIRRVIMQRREIRTAWAYANMYSRRWRAARDELGDDHRLTAAHVIEKALGILNDNTAKTAKRVAEARKVLGG